MKKVLSITVLCLSALVAAKISMVYKPGSRVIVLAHNAYPDHGKYGDRLDRVINMGRPFVVEQDLSWIDGKSLMFMARRTPAAMTRRWSLISFRK